jgi:predicted DNA-binding protein
MAKKPYKIKDARKDKTVSFRIPNQLYELLKKLSINNNQSVNTLARKLLIEYLNLEYPDNKKILNKLREEKERIEIKLKNIGKDQPDWERLFKEKQEELGEIESKRDELRSEFTILFEQLQMIKKRIKELNERRGGNI